MSTSLATEAPPAFICDLRVDSEEACGNEEFYKEKDGWRYCVLHYPDAEKAADFKAALARKLAVGDFNFRRVWFPEEAQLGGRRFQWEVNFSDAVFHAGADFSQSKFSGEAYFDRAEFHGGANFYYSAFSGDTYFHYAEFNYEADFRFVKFYALAYFRGVTFGAGANFEVAEFRGESEFTAVKFRAPAGFSLRGTEKLGDDDFYIHKSRASANFSYARISDYKTFSSERDPAFDAAAFLDLQFANIDKPERVAFRTLTLRPHWFVNVDARKFDLSKVEWDWRQLRPIKRWRGITVRRELGELRLKRVTDHHRALSVACRNLALNAEENHRYDEASRFRYMAMDARRVESAGGFRPWTLGWWYWLASGYGERIVRAVVVFLVIWLGFALLYYSSPRRRCLPGGEHCIRWALPRNCTGAVGDADPPRPGDCRPFESFGFSVVYTIETMTLQKPEPRPVTSAARVAVFLCAILGPLQAALLALAVRRRFMR